MSAPIKPLTENFAVAPQPGPDDMADSAAAYKSVIINRPDFEGGRPDQHARTCSAPPRPPARIESAVVGSAMTIADVQRFAELLRTCLGPAAGLTAARAPGALAAAQQLA